MTMPGRQATICLVGAGPRGTAVLERIAAHAASGGAGDIGVDVVDPYPLGAGRVWEPDQSRELVMNTLAGEVTLFTDETVTCAGPVVPGPSLSQWCRLAAGAASKVDMPDAVAAAYHAHPVSADLLSDEGLAAEMRAIEPWSHPTRVLYGHYLAWCFERAAASLPRTVTLRRHRAVAVAVRDEGDGRRTVELGDGGRLVADAVVIAPGWLAASPSEDDRSLTRDLLRAGLVWIPPASPREQDLDRLAPGRPVIVRGIGMGFFDAMALLTIGRGGRFQEDGTTGHTVYHPSGAEPVLYVGSRRGVPFRSKSLFGALPPAPPHRFLRAAALEGRRGRIDFATEALPLILADAVEQYYTVLHRVKPEAFTGGRDEAGPGDGSVGNLLAALPLLDPRSPAWDELVAAHIADPGDRLDLDSLLDPANGSFGSAADFAAWMRDYIDEDLREGRRGEHSPLKAAAWSIAASRPLMARVAAFGGLYGASHVNDYARYLALAGMLGSGPPAFRMRQLLALMDAGLVRFIGPRTRVRVDTRRRTVVAWSERVQGSRVEGDALLDAWMHMPTVRRAEDPLLRSLLDAGLARCYRIDGPGPDSHVTEGIEVAPHTHRLVHADGTVDECVALLGIPSEDVHGSSLASPIPYTNSQFLREADSVALHALRTAARAGVRGHL